MVFITVSAFGHVPDSCVSERLHVRAAQIGGSRTSSAPHVGVSLSRAARTEHGQTEPPRMGGGRAQAWPSEVPIWRGAEMAIAGLIGAWHCDRSALIRKPVP